MNALRQSPFSGARALLFRGHGPSHGPDGRVLGQGIGKTFPFATAETAKKRYHVARAVWVYFTVGVAAPTAALMFSQHKYTAK